MRSNAWVMWAASVTLIGASAGVRSDEAARPNDGKAEAVGRTVGEITGAALGAVAGARGGRAGETAGATAGGKAGAEIGAAAGHSLDVHAEENKASGRGGPNDPRYNPMTLFDH